METPAAFDVAPEILEQLKDGDQLSWSTVFENYAELLRRDILQSLSRRGLSAISLDDIVQEVWTVAYEQIQYFTWRGTDSFYHWLRVIALRRVQKRLQKVQQQNHNISLDSFKGATSNTSAALDRFLHHHHLASNQVEKEVELHDELAALTEEVGRIKNSQHQEIVQRWLFGDEKPQSIASTYQMKTKTVSMVLWRFIKELRKK